MSALHDVGEVRDRERQIRVLLDEEEGRLLLLVDALDDPEDLLHELWCQPERWLVEEDDLWLRHESAADGEHLLLASREVAG